MPQMRQYLRLLRSYLGYKTELKRFLTPLYLTYVTTLNCNLKCPFCYAWKTKHKDELGLQEIETVFSSKILKNLISLGITGGEPFIRKDIVDVVSVITDSIPNLMDIRFTTNGFYPEKIVSNISEIMDVTDSHLSVKISMDGVESTHDEIRCEGSFSKAVTTLNGLKQLREEGNDLSISVGFTAVDRNIEDIWELYNTLGEDFEFFFKPAQTLPIAPGGCPPLPISPKTRQLLISFTNFYMEKEFSRRESLWSSSRKLYYRYLLDFLRYPKVRPVPCSAAYSHFKLDSNGDVYACSVSSLKLGNVKNVPLDKIWYSPLSFKIRKKIKNGDCTCCTACDLGPTILTCKWHEIILDYINSLVSSPFNRNTKRKN